MHTYSVGSLLEFTLISFDTFFCRQPWKDQHEADFEFKLGDSILEVWHKYKYLGVILNEFEDFTVTANVQNE